MIHRVGRHVATWFRYGWLSGLPCKLAPSGRGDCVISATIALVKSVDPTTYDAPGQQLTYTFTVTNSGNTTLSTIAIHEGAFSGSSSKRCASSR